MVTVRSDELHAAQRLRHLVSELVRRRAVVRIELAPLCREHVASMLEKLAARPVPAAYADALHARSGGNPFCVEELFAAEQDGVVAPASITELVLARVDRLGDAPSHCCRRSP